MTIRETTINMHRHGITITGSVDGKRGVSAELLSGLADAYPEYPIADAKVSQELDVVIALTSKEGSEKWREELGIE